jgi:hypothetical protein
MGKIVCFEGADNCGKTTMLRKVEEILIKDGEDVAVFKFPDYEGISGSPYGKQIKEMLRSDKENFTSRDFALKFVHAQVDDKIAAFDYILKLADEHDYLLLDRFLLSTIIYAASRFEALKYRYSPIAIDRNVVEYVSHNYDKYHRKCIFNLLDTFKDVLYIVFDRERSSLFFNLLDTDNLHTAKDVYDTDKVLQGMVQFLYSCTGFSTNKEAMFPEYFDNVETIRFDDYVKDVALIAGLHELHGGHMEKTLNAIVRITNRDIDIAADKFSTIKTNAVDIITRRIVADVVDKIYKHQDNFFEI